MRNRLMPLIAFVLVGCASDPVIQTIIQKVEVPIAVPSKVDTPVMPIFSFEKLSQDQDIFEKTKALLSDRKLHLGYEAELLSALNSCK